MHALRLPGCRPYAEAIAIGDADINRCPPGGEATLATLARMLDRDPPALDTGRGLPGPLRVAHIDERACIGCTLCISACPVDAIIGAPKRMHDVLGTLCSGCDLCVEPCPVDCIVMVPAGREWTRADATPRARATLRGDHRLANEARRRRTRCAETRKRKTAVTAALARARARRPAHRPLTWPARTFRRAAVALLLASRARWSRNEPTRHRLLAALDALWDFDHPAESEARFRAEVARHPPRSREALEATTQVARAQGLQRKFDRRRRDARRRVSARSTAQPVRVRVRYLLERGRARQFEPAPRTRRWRWFEQALAASANDTLPGPRTTASMRCTCSAIAAPPERATRLVSQGALPRRRRPMTNARAAGARRCCTTSAGRCTTAAMTQRRSTTGARRLPRVKRRATCLAPASRAGPSRADCARSARSTRPRRCSARSPTSSQAANAPDGYVFEELAEIAVARGDRAAAQPWAGEGCIATASKRRRRPRAAELTAVTACAGFAGWRRERSRQPEPMNPAEAPRDLRAAARRQSRIRRASSRTRRRSSCWSPSCCRRRRPTRA